MFVAWVWSSDSMVTDIRYEGNRVFFRTILFFGRLDISKESFYQSYTIHLTELTNIWQTKQQAIKEPNAYSSPAFRAVWPFYMYSQYAGTVKYMIKTSASLYTFLFSYSCVSYSFLTTVEPHGTGSASIQWSLTTTSSIKGKWRFSGKRPDPTPI